MEKRGQKQKKQKNVKPGSVRIVNVKPTGKKVLKLLKKINTSYAVVVGLVLMAIMLPVTAYFISKNQQTTTGEAAANGRPYFSSISPKAGEGKRLLLTTVVGDPDGRSQLSLIGLWFDDRYPVSSRTNKSFHGYLIREASGWRYYGTNYIGNQHTCDDGSVKEACWMNYSYNEPANGFAPSDNSSSKIYIGGSYSDSTSSGGSRTAAWKVRSVKSIGSSKIQIVWDITFLNNFPTEEILMYLHAHDSTEGTGSWHNSDYYWTREGTGAWSTVETNKAPVISSKPSTAVKSGQLYRYEIIASDANGDTLSYATSKRPSWLGLSNNVLSGTPSDSDVGTHSVVVVVSDGQVSTAQAFSITVYKPKTGPTPTPTPPEEENEPPSVAVQKPDKDSIFRGADNLIVWTASDPDGLSGVSVYYSLDGSNWISIAEGLAGSVKQYQWDVSSIISGKYYVKVSAVDSASDPLVGTDTSPEFTIDNNPRGDNKPVIRGLNPGNNDVIETAAPTISAAYDSGTVDIDLNSVELKLDGEVMNTTVLASSCHYTPDEPLSSGTHSVELRLRNVNGDSAEQTWSFTIVGEISPEGPDIEEKEVMDLPIIGQVSKGTGLALIICTVVLLVGILIFATIRLVQALRKGEDEDLEIPQYYADYGEGGEPLPGAGPEGGEGEVGLGDSIEFSEEAGRETAFDTAGDIAGDQQAEDLSTETVEQLPIDPYSSDFQSKGKSSIWPDESAEEPGKPVEPMQSEELGGPTEPVKPEEPTADIPAADTPTDTSDSDNLGSLSDGPSV